MKSGQQQLIDALMSRPEIKKLQDMVMTDVIIFGQSGEVITKWNEAADKVDYYYKHPEADEFKKVEV